MMSFRSKVLGRLDDNSDVFVIDPGKGPVPGRDELVGVSIDRPPRGASELVIR